MLQVLFYLAQRNSCLISYRHPLQSCDFCELNLFGKKTTETRDNWACATTWVKSRVTGQNNRTQQQGLKIYLIYLLWCYWPQRHTHLHEALVLAAPSWAENKQEGVYIMTLSTFDLYVQDCQSKYSRICFHQWLWADPA